MDMFNIIEKAQKEGMNHEKNILLWLKAKRDVLINKGMKSTDVSVPVEYLYAIEKIADSVGVPFHYICGDTFSIGLTYSDLLKHERER